MLRLVHPSPEGKETRTSKRRNYRANFTPAQCSRIRALLRNLRTAYGSWSCLAEATGYGAGTLRNIAAKPSKATYLLVAEIAKAAGMTVDEALSPRLTPVAGCCPICGRKGAR